MMLRVWIQLPLTRSVEKIAIGDLRPGDRMHDAELGVDPEVVAGPFAVVGGEVATHHERTRRQPPRRRARSGTGPDSRTAWKATRGFRS